MVVKIFLKWYNNKGIFTNKENNNSGREKTEEGIGMEEPKKIMTLFVLDDEDKRELLKNTRRVSGAYESGTLEPDISRVSGDAAVGAYEPDIVPDRGRVVLQPIPVSGLEITLSPEEFVYDRTEKRPEVTVRNGTSRLINGRDYTVSYRNNVNAGQGCAEIRGQGKSYTGSVTKTFRIVPPASGPFPVPPAGLGKGLGHDSITEVFPPADDRDQKKTPENGGKGIPGVRGRVVIAACIAALFIAGIAGGIAISIARNGGSVSTVSADAEISGASVSEGLIKESSGSVSSKVDGADTNAGKTSVIKTSPGSKSETSPDGESSVNEETSAETTSDESSDGQTEVSSPEPSVKQPSIEEQSVYTPASEPAKVSEPSVVTSKPVVVSEPSPSGNEQKPDDGVSQSGAELVSAPSAKTVASLTIVSEPSKKQYRIGNLPDMTGMLVRVVYDDGSEKNITGNECLISGFDSSSAGTKNVTVSYGGKSASIKLEVVGETQTDQVLTGNCGESLTYRFTQGILTISGSGKMYDYEEASPFADDMTVKNAVVKKGVTCLGEFAFAYCGQLAGVELANTITDIGGYAFSECSALVSIKLPSSLERIRFCAFSGCTSLTELTLPEGLTAIEDNAFSGCVSLEKIVIPESVTDIDPTAFDGCKSLTIYCKAGSAAEKFAKDNGKRYSVL